MIGREPVERDRCAGGPFQFFSSAIRLHIERFGEYFHAPRDLRIRDFAAQSSQFVHFQDLNMTAERDALLGEVCIDIEHPVVIMPHDAKTIMLHDVGHARGLHPVIDFPPALRIVAKHAGNLMKLDTCAVEDIGNFRNRTGRAMTKPFTRHGCAIFHGIERRIINRGFRRKIQNDDRHLGAAHDGQHGRGKRIRCDVQENQIHIGPAKGVPRFKSLFRRIDQAEVDDINSGASEFAFDGFEMALKPVFKPGELRPVCIKTNAKEPDSCAILVF